MPCHLLSDPRQTHAEQLRTRLKRSTWLGAALVVLAAACSSSTDVEPSTTNGADSAGAAAKPTAAATTAADGKPAAAKPASSTPAASASVPPAAASGANASGAANAPSSASAPGTPAAGNAPAAMAAMPANMGTPGSAAAPTDPVADTDLPVEMGTPTLYWLEIASGVVTKAAADGSGAKVVASGSPLSAPDGVTVDPEGKHFYVLNMGSVIGGGNSGSLVQYNLDGTEPKVIMKPGAQADGQTFNTGKQVTIDRKNKKLYLGDREGTKVWRCDLDGGNLEVLVSGHGVNQIVGVAADPTKRQFYFSDRNGLKLFRAGMDMPAGKTHADRDDVELLYVEKAPSAMPLDIELDIKNRMMYWTDRNQNKVFGMGMDIPAGSDPMTRTDVKTIASNLTQAIGMGLDPETGTLYVTHSGSVSMVKTDGTGLKQIGSNGSTGIHFVKIP